MEATLQRLPGASPRCWCALFEARFDPRLAAVRRGAARRAAGSWPTAMAGSWTTVTSLDQDRILRSFLTLIQATLRTSFFQRGADGRPKSYVAFKLDPRAVPDLPAAAAALRDLRLLAAVRGRAPAVRRGGPRRPALVGPPGGLPHRGPGPGQGADGQERGDRAGRRQGRLRAQSGLRRRGTERRVAGRRLACYRQFVSALLDVTDNIAGGGSCRRRTWSATTATTPTWWWPRTRAPPPSPTWPTRSRAKYGFWLGDAFASGGSAGYDHKKMGITARGAWESVKRHFRELGRRHPDARTSPSSASATCPATCSATGCCSREHIQLVAAFDHRHIFLDPDPDAGDVLRGAPAAVRAAPLVLGRLRPVADLGGRRRLPAYRQVHPGHAAGPARRSVCRRRSTALSPHELMQGDPARRRSTCCGTAGSAPTSRRPASRTPRSATRPTTRSGSTAAQLRAKVVGEGGNLGFTQRGRVEYALRRRPDLHRLHRQLGRRGLLRPRGQHQDPARRSIADGELTASATSCWRR